MDCRKVSTHPFLKVIGERCFQGPLTPRYFKSSSCLGRVSSGGQRGPWAKYVRCWQLEFGPACIKMLNVKGVYKEHRDYSFKSVLQGLIRS